LPAALFQAIVPFWLLPAFQSAMLQPSASELKALVEIVDHDVFQADARAKAPEAQLPIPSWANAA